MMPRPPNPYRDQIRADYAAGMKKKDIAERHGIHYASVIHATKDMPRVRPYSEARRRKVLMPVGKNYGLVNRLTDEQLFKLDCFARKIGCTTLMEAVLEIVRDELEEMK